MFLYNGAVAIERGPLVYSLQLGENRTRVNADKPHRELPHGDFEIRPTTPWNYALALNEAKPEASVSFEERPVGERPFSPEGAGVIGKVKGRKLPGCKVVRGWADGQLATLASSDGVAWQRVEDPVLYGRSWQVAVTHGPYGWVIGGRTFTETFEETVHQAAAWRSADMVEWTPAPYVPDLDLDGINLEYPVVGCLVPIEAGAPPSIGFGETRSRVSPASGWRSDAQCRGLVRDSAER